MSTLSTHEIRASALWNSDLAPTTPARRTWSAYDMVALWISMSVVLTTYTLASGLMQQGMHWWQAMLTILLGNLIVLLPMILNAHAGTKYGISFPVLCRASFGVRGANVPAVLRALVACGWFGIQTWIGGLALNALLSAAMPAWATLPGNTWIAFAAFWLLQVGVIIRGVEGIKILNSWSAPLLLAGGLLLLAWAIGQVGGLGRLLSESERLQTSDTPFWRLFPAALTANVGYWATLSLNIPDFSRYARSQRAQAIGQAIGLPPTMTLFAFIGVAVTRVLRRRQLSTPDLFDVNGRYRYSNGVNYKAMAALIVAMLPVIPGFLRAAVTPGGQVASPTWLDSFYSYAWFVTFAISFVVYLLLTIRTRARHR
ncbi:MAG: cytosine permease [Vicinamibacterales bacterium]